MEAVNIFVDFNKIFFKNWAMDKKVFFNTTVPESLIKEFKILAINLGKRQNQLLEEAIQDVLKKYEEKPHQLFESFKKVAAKSINPMIMSTMEKLLEEKPDQFYEAYERVLEKQLKADGSPKRKIKIKNQSSASD